MQAADRILDALELRERPSTSVGALSLVVPCHNEKNQISLTEKGLITQRYVELEHYIDICKGIIRHSETRDDIYWKIAYAGSPYGVILRDQLFGQEGEQEKDEKATNAISKQVYRDCSILVTIAI